MTNVVQGAVICAGCAGWDVQGLRPSQSWLVQRCRVFLTKLHTCVRATSVFIFFSNFTPCTYCTPCTLLFYIMFFIFHPAQYLAHPAHIIIAMKIVIERSNAKEISGFMKNELPEFHGLVKDLYAAGMIPGLRGITIETLTPEADQALALTLNDKAGGL